MSAALKMLLVVYLLRSTWFNSSSRVHASCQCSRCRPERRRPSLVQYCSTAFCFPVLFLWLLAPRPVPSPPSPGLACTSETWTASAVPAPRCDGGAQVCRGRVPAPSYKGPFFPSARAWKIPVTPHVFTWRVQSAKPVFRHAEVAHVSAGSGALHLGRVTPLKHRGPRAAAAVSSLQRCPSFIAARSICSGD